MPSNSLAATPPESPAPAASESPRSDEQDPLTLVAFDPREAEAAKRLCNPARSVALLAVTGCKEYSGFVHNQQHPGAACGVVDGALAGG